MKQALSVGWLQQKPDAAPLAITHRYPDGQPLLSLQTSVLASA
jgi:hypothetical protein